MIKSVFLFFFWLNNIYDGSAAVAVAQNLAIRLPMMAECSVVPPAGWVPYTVRSTDALADLANRAGITVEELVAVNCLAAPEVIAPLLLLAPKPLVPVTLTGVATVSPSTSLTTVPTERSVSVTIPVTTSVTPSVTAGTTAPTPPTALAAPVSATLALSGSLLLLPTPEPVTVTDAKPMFWSVNGIGGISALILLVLLVLRDSIRNLQGRWQRFYLLLNRLLLPLLLLFLLLVVIRLIGVL